ncbi:hypothetical protein C4K68_18615 [Pokkaliibacter plantistimulans]|uniref:Uncharacterized protein n=1 Tax=Proteobacteria bacterium 228 TaxID=2083153 RepID=A0A2S5KM98_9PROT|nr:hypothetical protein [Pokkaliibacter plantistimulans]PPC75783.1 hypothetical protein C4K68_18615 [Pokkaliibacter plantistimulans]
MKLVLGFVTLIASASALAAPSTPHWPTQPASIEHNAMDQGWEATSEQLEQQWQQQREARLWIPGKAGRLGRDLAARVESLGEHIHLASSAATMGTPSKSKTNITAGQTSSTDSSSSDGSSDTPPPPPQNGKSSEQGNDGKSSSQTSGEKMPTFAIPSNS